MIRVKLFLNSGQIVEFETPKIATQRNGLGEFVGMEWTRHKRPMLPDLFHVDVDRIAAIVLIDETPQEPPEDDRSG